MNIALLAFVGCGGSFDALQVSEGLPQLVGPVDVILSGHFVSSASTRTDELSTTQDPLLIALALQTATAYPALTADQAEACWEYDVELDSFGGDIGPILTVQVGATEVDLAAEGPGIYTASLSGTAASAASTPGAELVVDGQATGVVLPDPLQPRNLAETVARVGDDGVLSFQWDLGDAGAPDHFIQLIIQGGGVPFLLCALEDDGQADIDLGVVPDASLSMQLSRLDVGIVQSTTLGTVVATMTQDVEIIP